jgi:DNA invertase Pin-like site-specific DNA recombinase
MLNQVTIWAMIMKQFVVYTRVSTKRQGDSGLGLEAQERDIAIFFESYAEQPYEVLERFCDVEGGSKADRLQLTAAMDLAKRTGATLLVAKLDRLSRSVAFIATLLEDRKLEFRVATMPYADKFQLHIYAALAEQEREFISKRTKAALQAAKARGVKLGGARPEAEARHAAVKATADGNAARVSKAIKSHRSAGATYREIAEHLNHLKVTTARGGAWYATTVRNYDLRVV